MGLLIGGKLGAQFIDSGVLRVSGGGGAGIKPHTHISMAIFIDSQTLPSDPISRINFRVD